MQNIYEIINQLELGIYHNMFAQPMGGFILIMSN